MNRIKNWTQRNIDILLVFVSVFFIEWMIRVYMDWGEMSLPIYIINLSFAFFLSSWMSLMGRKTRLIYTILVFVFLGILSAGQILHYNYFSTFFSFTKASILSELNTVKGEISTKIQWSLLVFFIPVVICILGFALRGKPEKPSWAHRFLIWGICLGLGIVGMFSAVKMYPAKDVDSESDQYLYSTLFNNVKAVQNLGFYSFELRDFVLTNSGNSTANPEENEVTIESFLQENQYQATPNEYTGLFEGKNLILVLCESLSPGVISEELTPTLYRMKTEGFSFNNHYAPIYQTATCDSEFISLTGMIPSTSGSPITYHYYQNDYPTALPLLLDAKGYSSNSFHAYSADFYNRRVLHQAFGFTWLYDWTEFGGYEEAQRPDFVEAYNWVEDKYLAQNMLDETKSLGKYPFFDFMISVTGHIPYDRYRYELEYNLWATQEIYGQIGEQYSEEVLCYYAAQRTLEEAMGTLVEGLEADGTLEDTVFVLYGDHYPYGMSEAGLKEYYGDTYNTVQMNQTPFIIWTPDIEGQQISSVTSTYDIYPTLCNLFGVDIDGDFIVGRDALDDSKESLVIFSDYSWLNNHAYYDATKQTVTKFDDITDEKVQEITDRVFQDIAMSQKIIDINYYATGKAVNP